ncbi:hypothetical protein CASFOL_017182 [Castilleja foliolosa]|uniref:Uncharacterized protein n=1 Tax=Castilleja foliolosa TaxID=1961234 RepID=A0ABD3DAD0_9LAMI
MRITVRGEVAGKMYTRDKERVYRRYCSFCTSERSSLIGIILDIRCLIFPLDGIVSLFRCIVVD